MPGPAFRATCSVEADVNAVSARITGKGVLGEDPEPSLGCGGVCVHGGDSVSRESFLEQLAFEDADSVILGSPMMPVRVSHTE